MAIRLTKSLVAALAAAVVIIVLANVAYMAMAHWAFGDLPDIVVRSSPSVWVYIRQSMKFWLVVVLSSVLAVMFTFRRFGESEELMMYLREKLLSKSLLLIMLILNFAIFAFGWGDEGHKLVNKTAVGAIPADMPAFFKAGGDKIVYNGPEPDRWRTVLEPSLKNDQEPDHYIDMERVSDIGEFPVGRYDFIRWAYAKKLSSTAYSDDFLPERIGFQPYITAEVYERLKVAFRSYRQLKAAGQPTDAVENDALFYAGWLGHYVADGCNPLHTTIQHNGWVGPNPNGYTTAHIHWPVESDFVNKNLAKLDPAALVKAPQHLDDPFRDYVAYLRRQFAMVEPLYQIEKRGGFNDPGSDEAREFMRRQMSAGSQMLVNLWYTAWIDSEKPVPAYKPDVTPAMKPAAQPATTQPKPK